MFRSFAQEAGHQECPVVEQVYGENSCRDSLCAAYSQVEDNLPRLSEMRTVHGGGNDEADEPVGNDRRLAMSQTPELLCMRDQVRQTKPAPDGLEIVSIRKRDIFS